MTVLNDKKICFITCVNNEAKYKESLLYISRLNVPEGYEIETVAVRNARSMASGYNRGMASSDAKYKVYLHQDVFILDKDFITDLIKIFKSDEKIGLIGVAGVKTMPLDGVWWNSAEMVGRVYDNHTTKMDLLQFSEPDNGVHDVEAVDGLMFATQYDIPFREDLFDGWHYYDISEAFEFLNHGYRVVVPSPEKPWCLHDCGVPATGNAFEKYRRAFVGEYLKDRLPLVSILIPTYNRPHCFELALKSVLEQTYPNIEIIVGDDSTDNRTEKLMKEKYLDKYSNITYYHNEKNLGQFDNDLKLMEMAKGEYINFLMDDDLFAKDKIEKMMAYFIADKNDEISFVTSHRELIDENGKSIGIFSKTNEFIKSDTVFNGRKFGDFYLRYDVNIIGEPTTVLFKKSKLKAPFGTFGGVRYICNVDQASWLELLSQGSAVFINEVLSYFRIHKNQQLNSARSVLGGIIDYGNAILTGRERGFLQDEAEYAAALKNFCFHINRIISFTDQKSLSADDKALYSKCLEYKKKFSSLLSQVDSSKLEEAERQS